MCLVKVMNYGNKLRYLREEKELTQQEIANIIKINRVQYNQYENDYNTIPLRHLVNLCNYFNVSLDYILDFTDTMQYDNIRMDIDANLLKQRLKEARKHFNLTQKILAIDFKISRTTIAEYERGKNLVSTSFLYAFCLNYRVSADYLLGRIDEPKFLK